jgi:hypothetical protein
VIDLGETHRLWYVDDSFRRRPLVCGATGLLLAVTARAAVKANDDEGSAARQKPSTENQMESRWGRREEQVPKPLLPMWMSWFRSQAQRACRKTKRERV